MTTAFFIDYENTHGGGLVGFENIDDNDIIYIFFNPNDSFPIRYLSSDKMKCVEFKTSYVGTPNAIDFQLISFLGSKIMDPYIGKFVVVSKDKGYEPAVQMWKDAGYNVTIQPNIGNLAVVANVNNGPKVLENNSQVIINGKMKSINKEAVLEKIKHTYMEEFPKASMHDIEFVNHIISSTVNQTTYGTKCKMTMLNNAIQKEFKESELVKLHYGIVKKCITATAK